MVIRVPLDAHEDDGADAQGRNRAVAFESLWQHRAALREICQRIVGDVATADDVVQETYIRALRNIDDLEDRPTLMPWLATVARRRSIDELRRRRYQRPVASTPDDCTRPELDPGELAGVSETVGKVRKALTVLTERERELLTRQVNHGMSLAELARFDNSSIASVRSVLSRARTKLRDALTEAGARVLVTVGSAGEWARRKLGGATIRANARLQRVAQPVLPGGYQSLGEMATAATAVAALAVTGLLPAAGGTTVDDAQPDVGTFASSASATANEGDPGPTAPSGAFDFRREGSSATAATSPAGAAPTAAASSGESAGSAGGPAVAAPQTPDGWPNPNSTAPHSVPQPGNPLEEPNPDDPDDADITKFVSPAPAAGSSGQVVFALGEGTCETRKCEHLWSSDDGGRSWTKAKGEGLDNVDSILVPDGYSNANGRHIYATSGSGLLVSTDGGEHFSPVASAPYAGPAAISPRYFGGDPRVYLGAQPNWRYDDATKLTTPLIMNLPGEVANFAFVAGVASTDLMFAGTRDAGEDDWVGKVFRCEAEDCSVSFTFDGLVSAPHVAVPSYSSGDVVLAWHRSTLFRSMDGGRTFSSVTLPIPGKVQAFDDDGAGAIYLAIGDGLTQSGGLLRSTDDGTTWEVIGQDTSLAGGVHAVAALEDGTLLASPRESGLLCSVDHGTTWSKRCP